MPHDRSFTPLALSLVLFLSAPAHADPKPCTCQNLESLQQEYQNAVYLEGYMRKLAEHLKGVEARQRGLNLSTNADPESGDSVIGKSKNARDAYEVANLKLPFPMPKDYKGPSRISMEEGKCSQPKADLDAMRDGSPCEAIADAALAHELAHVNICTSLGAEAYWTRMPSVFALEEAEMYKAQAANLKDELRRVMDASDLRLVGQFRNVMGDIANGFTDEVTYDSGDISLASQGGDRWTMTGTGETFTTAVLQSQADGAVCKSTPMKNTFSVTLRTDGLTVDVETTGHVGKDVTLVCNNGIVMPFYSGDFGEIEARRLKVAGGDTDLPREGDWLMSASVGAAAGAGASMTVEQLSTLRLTCEGP